MQFLILKNLHVCILLWWKSQNVGKSFLMDFGIFAKICATRFLWIGKSVEAILIKLAQKLRGNMLKISQKFWEVDMQILILKNLHVGNPLWWKSENVGNFVFDGFWDFWCLACLQRMFNFWLSRPELCEFFVFVFTKLPEDVCEDVCCIFAKIPCASRPISQFCWDGLLTGNLDFGENPDLRSIRKIWTFTFFCYFTSCCLIPIRFSGNCICVSRGIWLKSCKNLTRICSCTEKCESPNFV